MADDERAIRDLVKNWMNATRAGDLPAVLDMMADDVIFMVPGQEPFGKEVFAANSARLGNVRIDGNADILEIRIFGQVAYLRNHIEVVMTPTDGGVPKRRKGYTLTILRKEPTGQWVIVRDANLVA